MDVTFGDGVRNNISTAAYWFRKAAEQGTAGLIFTGSSSRFILYNNVCHASELMYTIERNLYDYCNVFNRNNDPNQLKIKWRAKIIHLQCIGIAKQRSTAMLILNGILTVWQKTTKKRDKKRKVPGI